MRILEVRDSFIKIETNKSLVLSSFLKITEEDKIYIAQVIQIKQGGGYTIAYAKILFNYNNGLQIYDKTLPSLKAEVCEFGFKELSDFFAYNEPVIAGLFIKDNENISLNKSYFNKNLLISIDNSESKKTIIKNLSMQFANSIIIDTSGTCYEGKKFVAGVDFKLPLNTSSLEFIFEDCLMDATSDSKSLIKEIFQDLAVYSRTVPFLPFMTLKTIIDDMVDKSHIFKLLVLKNKLSKFDKLGYFASTQKEADNLNNILKAGNCVIDLSKLDPIFQNRYVSIIYSTMENLNLNNQVFIEASGSINKKNLKTILTEEVPSTLIVNSRFRFIKEIKSMFNNFIIEPNFINNELFKTFSTILKSMQKDSYLIIGEGTNFIPLISSVSEIDIISDAIDKNNQEDLLEQVEAIEDFVEISSEDANEVLAELEIQSEEEKDPSIVAIEQKSDELIEKVTKEIDADDKNQDLILFEDDNIEIIDNEQETSSETSPETITEDFLIEENSEENLSTEECADNESFEEDSNSFKEEFHTQVDEIKTVEITDEILTLTEEQEDLLTEDLNEVVADNIIVTDDSDLETEENIIDESEFLDRISEDNVLERDLTQPEENTEEDIEILINSDDSDFENADIIVEIDSDSDTADSDATDDIDKEIVEDVDKVFTTIKDETLSDSDLDFIDELNSEIDEDIVLSEGMEELTELQDFNENNDDEFVEPLIELSDSQEDNNEDDDEKEILETRSASTPIVPVYGAEIPAEDLVISDPIEQGDTVIHSKYGNGVVEKMIKYGAKTLFSINFDNVGRRLLDPTLTEIKKV